MQLAPSPFVILDRKVTLGAGQSRASRTLRAPGFAVQLLEVEGFNTDTRFVHDAFVRDVPENTLTVVLAGEYESSASGSAVHAGSLAFERRDQWLEQWTGRRQRFLMAVWNGGDAPSGRETLGPNALRWWRLLAEQIELAQPEDAARIGAVLLSRLSALGLQPPAMPTSMAPPEVQRVAGALSHVFSHLHESPGWIDLEARTGLGERQLRRILRNSPDWLPSSLRRELLIYRLSAASTLLDGSNTAVDEVARALGYRSDRALHTAIRRARAHAYR
ncbi:MAG: AraC family transcriptional regulator [Myxococcota bacterium]